MQASQTTVPVLLCDPRLVAGPTVYCGYFVINFYFFIFYLEERVQCESCAPQLDELERSLKRQVHVEIGLELKAHVRLESSEEAEAVPE